VIEPRYSIFLGGRRIDRCRKAISYISINRDEICGSPGSESRACIEGKMMNVGDPLYSSGRMYQLTNLKSEEIGKV
jgi:hypothetical protein